MGTDLQHHLGEVPMQISSDNAPVIKYLIEEEGCFVGDNDGSADSRNSGS